MASPNSSANWNYVECAGAGGNATGVEYDSMYYWGFRPVVCINTEVYLANGSNGNYKLVK